MNETSVPRPADGTPGEITQVLACWVEGDVSVENRLIELVAGELRARAAAFLRSERPDHTLQATALVNEAYLRLATQRKKDWRTRAHFFGVASHLMRLILVDHARRRRAIRHGGGLQRVTFDQLDRIRLFDDDQAEALIALEDALVSLAKIDPRSARVIECRFFAEMTVRETAEYLKCSEKTVKNDWAMARAWLFDYLSKS